MFAFKKNYFLIIESIKDINLCHIKKRHKFIIIYRNLGKKENFFYVRKFRLKCKSKHIKFFVANDIKLAVNLKADGLYLSSKNVDFKSLNLKRKNFAIIGSAHNIKEINHKINQGCNSILLSRLFEVSYKLKLGFMGINKFNVYALNVTQNLVPLGGIKISNLNYLKNVKSNSFALLTEIKKKPTKIISRLF